MSTQCHTDWAADWRRAWLWPATFALAALGWLIVPAPAGDVVAAVGFAAAGALCVANAVHCRRVHCAFTGPLYLIAALLFGGRLVGPPIPAALIVTLAVVGSIAAFVPEWRGKKYFSATVVPSSCGSQQQPPA